MNAIFDLHIENDYYINNKLILSAWDLTDKLTDFEISQINEPGDYESTNEYLIEDIDPAYFAEDEEGNIVPIIPIQINELYLPINIRDVIPLVGETAMTNEILEDWGFLN